MSSTSFYFYDLETSGINPRESRVMQFAGQRVDLDLNVMGEPHNIVIELSEDILPDPDAIMVTGITPQFTKSEGTTEAEFLKTFFDEIAAPGTIFVGYNTVRFDDEFMRCMLYRNFYDPYKWQWKDDRSRWDLLDVVRMTRALRPDGIKWPVDDKGNPTNRLELLTSLNGLDHSHAHDALNDVKATIALAQLIRSKQPKLFDYLLSMRSKSSVQKLVESAEPFVYSSGKYPSDFQKTTIVAKIAEHPNRGGALVYDLRHDPDLFSAMSVSELADAWRWIKYEDRSLDKPRLPIKALQFNRCPAIAPLAVIREDKESQQRLQIDMNDIMSNYKKLQFVKDWPDRILGALKIIDGEQQKRYEGLDSHVDGQIYGGFMSDSDNKIMRSIRQAKPELLAEFIDKCSDKRLKELLPLYKARNYPRKLSDEERVIWEKHRTERLFAGGQQSKLAKYFARIEELSSKPDITPQQKSILEDLTLYGQSLMPSDME
jgi:exodeoxyribonuclease I